MIFHLMSAGMPITWTVVAVYGRCYGIAIEAARAWSEAQAKNHGESPYARAAGAAALPEAHFVIEVDDRTGAWTTIRQNLTMSPRYLKRREHDERPWLLQDQTSPFPIEPSLKAALAGALHGALVEFGYLIPRSEWEIAHPAQKIIADRFRTFREAEKAHRASGAEGPMPFELRWAQFMERPEGFAWPFEAMRVDDTWTVTMGGRRLARFSPTDEEEATSIARILNSGYRPEDVDILMADTGRDEPGEEKTQ